MCVCETSYETSHISIPQAEKAAGAIGTMTSGMPSSLARIEANSGPPPPKATRGYSAGSLPSSTVICLIAAMLFVTVIFIIPAAACTSPIPSGFATCSSTPSLASFSASGISPERKLLGSMYPRITAASVTVGLLPPLLYDIGPGSAAALSGPTCSNPSLTEEMEPPPAPTDLMSYIVTRSG